MMVYRAVFVGCLFFLLVLEGTVLQWVLPQAWGSTIVIVPQLVVAGVVILSLFRGERAGLIYGFGFGLLYDVVYGPVLGMHAFTMAAVGYFAGLISRQFAPGAIVSLLTTSLSITVHLVMTYGLFRLFGLTDMDWNQALVYHVAPSVVFNVVAALPVDRVFRWVNQKWDTRSLSFD
jgi:rod shape-determining protein MreD